MKYCWKLMIRQLHPECLNIDVNGQIAMKYSIAHDSPTATAAATATMIIIATDIIIANPIPLDLDLQ